MALCLCDILCVMLIMKIKFRPEQRKEKNTGELISKKVPLLADVNYRGRDKPLTGIRLLDISDYDVEAQKFTGKKVLLGNLEISITQANAHLNNFKTKVTNAFNKLLLSDEPFTINDVIKTAFPKPAKIQKVVEESSTQKILKQADRMLKANTIGIPRHSRYLHFSKMIDRYEKIFNKSFNLKSLDIDTLLDFQEFIKYEAKYYKSHPDLYKDERKLTAEIRTDNTVAGYFSLLSGILTEFKYENIIKEGGKLGKSLTAERYDEPYALSIDELLSILKKDYPAEIKLERDSFLVQCAVGLRVDDYWRVSQEPVNVTPNGIYYISYTASKTLHLNDKIEVIETPIVAYAKAIIDEYGEMPFKKHLRGDITTTYNVAIRRLLRYWGITRLITVRDEQEGIKKVPLCDEASSKLARKTFVDIINKAQINNPYLAGVHKEGSEAVNRYTSLDIETRYRLFSLAFRQE